MGETPSRICGAGFPHARAGLRRGRRPARPPPALLAVSGCLVRPWAAARPRAVRAASLRLGASSRSPARPRRRPRAPQPGPLDPPAPSTPVTRGVLCVARRVGATQARPCRRPQAPQPGPLEAQPSHTPTPQASHPTLPALIAESTPNFARNSPTTLSNFEYRSLELQRLWMVSKSDRGKLCATYVSLGSCHRLWAPQLDFSGPSGALHTSDAWRAVCCQARRCDSGQALPPPTGTAALSARLLWV